MLKEIREVKNGLYRVTTLDERWYGKPKVSAVKGIPTEYEWFPSSTWICGYYPKGKEFENWLKENGKNADSLRDSAGATGSKVHYACEDIDRGKKVDLRNGKYMNNVTGQLEELTQHEIDCVLSYRDYIEEFHPLILANEITAFGDFYGGTIDKIFAFPSKDPDAPRQIWLVDLKTSKRVKFEFTLQLSSYSHMNINYEALGISETEWSMRRLAVLQLGYGPNKRHNFTEMRDRYDFFKNVIYPLWQEDNPDAKPKQRDYPLEIFSPFRIEQLKKEGKLEPEEAKVSEFEQKLKDT